MLLNLSGIENTLDERSSSFELKTTPETLFFKWDNFFVSEDEIDQQIATLLRTNPALLDSSKWGNYLPLDFQVKLLKERYFDFPGTDLFLTNSKLKLAES